MASTVVVIVPLVGFSVVSSSVMSETLDFSEVQVATVPSANVILPSATEVVEVPEPVDLSKVEIRVFVPSIEIPNGFQVRHNCQ